MDALRDAFHSIWEIITGVQSHPIVAVFKSQSRKGVARPEWITHFHQQYSIPILDGDEDLIRPLLTDLEARLGHNTDNETTKTAADDATGIHRDGLIYGIAHMLFRLVILRGYLEREPSDDDEIYRLVVSAAAEEKVLEKQQATKERELFSTASEQTPKNDLYDPAALEAEMQDLLAAIDGDPLPPRATTRIVRKATLPEQVLAALMGWDDTTSMDNSSVYPLKEGYTKWAAIIKVDPTLETRHDTPLAYVHTPQYPTPYAWPPSQSLGLTGGPAYTHCKSKPSTQLTMTASEPPPATASRLRPRSKTAVNAPEQKTAVSKKRKHPENSTAREDSAPRKRSKKVD